MNVTVTKEAPVLRPLGVLVPLIKKDLEQARAVHTAAEKASEPYYFAIGDKLIEAKAQLASGEFTQWVSKNFKFGQRQAQQYMALARATSDTQKRVALRAMEEMSFNAAVREHTSNVNLGRPAAWREDIKDNVQKARVEARRLALEDSRSRADERAAEKKLALRLIDIGFKVLVKELHPDKGGTKDAMSRLSRVRTRLKQYA
jgi:hypothetical protein